MDAPTIEKALRNHPFFENVAKIDLFSSCAEAVTFQADTYIFREGETADKFFVITHGQVGLEIADPREGEVVIESIDENNILGWSWLFDPYQWHFDARAMTLVRAFAIDGDCIRKHFDENPALGYEMMQRFGLVLMSRLQQTRIRLLDIYK